MSISQAAKRGRPFRRPLGRVEQLEPRIVLDGRLVISEVMADGSAGPRDQFGENSDWLEIFNPTSEPVSLAGWSLTDSPQSLDKWRFPDGQLGPGQFLLVYASGRDVREANQPLHTNFRISESDEYLAIVAPDQQVEHALERPAGTVPEGVSYGLAQAAVSEMLIDTNHSLRWYLPTLENGADQLGTLWQQPGFDDSAWAVGQFPIGFHRRTSVVPLQTDVLETMHRQSPGLYVRASFEVRDVEAIEALELSIHFDDGYELWINGQSVQRRRVPFELDYQSTATESMSAADVARGEQIDLTDARDLLVSGANTLAIHGVNLLPADSSFLLAPTLRAIYAGPVNVADAGVLARPTPGASNEGRVVQGVVGGVQIDQPHGFYDQPQTVSVTSPTAGATIWYTTDGSTPAPGKGLAQAAASPDEAPRLTLTVDRTTTLRAMAVRDGDAPSPVVTQTYIFLDDVLQQSPEGSAPEGWPSRPILGQRFDYGMDPQIVNHPEYGPLLKEALRSIPSVSLVTDLEHLFDRETGIFVNSLNSRGSGSSRSWERPASVELIDPRGDAGFQINAGIRMRGEYSRLGTNPKHAFRLFFRAEYGAPKLEYPMFEGEGVAEFDKLDLRTAQIPSWSTCWANQSPTSGGCDYNTMLREVLNRDVLGEMEQPYTRSRYYHLYLNGQYWGVFQSEERPDADFASAYQGGEPDEYDVIKEEWGVPYPYATNGTDEAWRELWLIAKAGFAADERYYRVQGLNASGERDETLPVLLDLDNLIDYMLVNYYGGNLDGPISNFIDNVGANNWFGFRNRNSDRGFQFMMHDAEWTFFNVRENRLGPFPGGDDYANSNPQWIHQQLMHNGRYRLRFADRVQRHLFHDGALTPAKTLQRLERRVAELELPIIAESARWGDTTAGVRMTKEDWLAQIRYIRDEYIPQRTEILLDQLRAELNFADGRFPFSWFPDFPAPTITPFGGPLELGRQVELLSDQAIYYTLDGTDPLQDYPDEIWQRVIAADAPSRYLIPLDDSLDAGWTEVDFDDSAWAAGQAAIGYEVGSEVLSTLIGTDISAAMYGVSPSAYLRIPFRLDELPSEHSIQLPVTYNDGFVAYLNGVEIARQHAPDGLAFDARATELVREGFAVHVVDLTDRRDLLRQGNNVLAIQGLNRTESNRSFLIRAELLLAARRDWPLAAGAQPYQGPIELTESTRIAARAVRHGIWSPLTVAGFLVEPSPLRISEIMYHPAVVTVAEQHAGWTDDDDFEFIELQNTAIDREARLGGLRLSGSLTIDLPDVSLAAGESALLVRNRAAFLHRYGRAAAAKVLLEYGGQGLGHLDNRQARLRLHDLDGSVIQDIAYTDDWYAETDGDAYSLEAIAAALLLPASDPAAWAPSVVAHGSPGTARPRAGDANQDGRFDSADLVQVFQRGEYEDGLQGNSQFGDGDWNGDGEFTSSDLVLAYQLGNYVAAATRAIDQLWAEPSAAWLTLPR